MHNLWLSGEGFSSKCLGRSNEKRRAFGGGAYFFFILSHCCALEEPGKSLVGMPRGCLVKEGKCFEGIIIFDVGQQIILSHNRAIANILSVVVLTTGMIN